jgi:hypothetical protein
MKATTSTKASSGRRRWKSAIAPKKNVSPSLPISVRFPSDLLEELGRYAEFLMSDRSYVIVECVRQVLMKDRAWRRARGQPRRP